jgi:SAM-dependent methyltransferase
MLFLKFFPNPIRSRLLKLAACLSIPGIKYTSEFYYWYIQLQNDGGTFRNGWYRDLMLNIAGETDENFVTEKIVADFGCGPRGSLCWATDARERVGIDVLVDKYRLLGIEQQNMRYVQSSEKTIPIETDSVDILFTVNAMDHVDNFEAMCSEVLRILKPGGEFIASFNLEEEATACEPQTLTEDRIRQSLLQHFNIQHYRMAKQGPKGNGYLHFGDGSDAPTEGPRYLWVRAQKLP